MVTHIRIENLSPHRATEIAFDADGTTLLAGPSECGKTTALEAVCFALWGTGSDGKALPVEWIRAEGKRASVLLTLSDGRELFRDLTRTRSQHREVGDGAGHPIPYTREEDFRAAAGPLSERGDLARLALAPFSWLPLLNGPGGGRPLRDALAKILPAGDLRSEVATLMEERGHALRTSDPLSEAQTVEVRRQRNSERDQVSGRKGGLEALAATLEAEVPATVSEEAIAEATAALHGSEDWKGYDTAVERHRAAVGRHEGREAERQAWLARRSELGHRPATDIGAFEAARSRRATADDAKRVAADGLLRADGEVSACRHGADLLRAAGQPTALDPASPEARAVSAAERGLSAATRRADAMAAAGDECPTCHRAGWQAHTGEVARAAAEVEEARLDLERAKAAASAWLAGLKRRYAAELSEAEARVPVAEAKRDGMGQLHAEVEAARVEAEAAFEVAAAAQAVPNAWDAQLRALGPEPSAAPAPGDAPAAPTVERPTASRVEGAQAVLSDASRSRGAASQRERDLAEARSALSKAAELLDELVSECARLDALVDAVRRAPSAIATKQMAAFGDLGPVTLSLPAEGPAVEFAVDGRPWWCASTGRQIVADLWFRAGLRRALGLPRLPLWVDRVQDVAGQELPDVGGPVVLLRSQDGEPSWLRGIAGADSPVASERGLREAAAEAADADEREFPPAPEGM